MYTLFDFITRIKGMEYIIAITFIGAFIVLWEVLKPQPFKGVVSRIRDDLGYLEPRGWKHLLKNVVAVVAAPFIGLAYIVALPFAFVVIVIKITGESLADGYRRLAGRKPRPAEKRTNNE